MVKVQLVNGKTVHKSWSNRRKYSRRSVLARKRALRCIENVLPEQKASTEHVLLQHDGKTYENQNGMDLDPNSMEEPLHNSELFGDPSASTSFTVNNLNQNDASEEVWTDNFITENFQVLSPDQYESVMSEELVIEKDTPPVANRFPIEGKRVVDLSYVLNWAVDFGLEHSRICTGGKLHLLKEQCDGLLSTLIFECGVCRRKFHKKMQFLSEYEKSCRI